MSDYTISEVLSQLALDDMSQWHPVAYYLCKMIPAKTWYKIYNGKLVAIVEIFRIWRYYLKGFKHKVFILINYNNLQQFIDTKSLSFCQVYWA